MVNYATNNRFHFVIEPKVGVGQIRFGMHKDEVSHAFTYVYHSFFKFPESKVRSDHIEVVGLIVHYNNKAEVNCLEVFPRPQHSKVTLELFGVDITQASVREVAKLLKKHSKVFTKNCYGYIFPELGVSTYNHDLQSTSDLVKNISIRAGEEAEQLMHLEL